MRARYALALLLVMAAPGCGKELVAGGQKHVDARSTGDGTPEGSASSAPAFDRSPAGGPSLAAAPAQGTITFTAEVVLLRADGQAVGLGSAQTAVKIDGSDTVTVVSGDVPAATYTAVRVTFTSVNANVTGGLVIGGVSLTGNVTVGTGEAVVVERAVNLGSPEASVRLLIDLDASAWLPAANPTTKVVASSVFQSAVKIRTS